MFGLEMTSSTAYFFLLATVAVLFHTSLGEEGATLSCYQCNSGAAYNGAACAAETGSDQLRNFLKQCPVGDGNVYTRCRKMVQDVEGETRVIRSCATANLSGGKYINRCIDRAGTFKIKVKYCECENDQPHTPCNVAAYVTSSSHLMLLFSGISAFLCLWAI